jgi:hypothetical protein
MSNSPHIKRNTQKNALYTLCLNFIRDNEITSKKAIPYTIYDTDYDQVVHYLKMEKEIKVFMENICKILGYAPKESEQKE